MDAVRLVAEKVEAQRSTSAPLLKAASAQLRASLAGPRSASQVTKALVNAMRSLKPAVEHPHANLQVSNSNDPDWHLLRQILTEGPVYVYLTPQSLPRLPNDTRCHIKLLCWLAEQRLVIPVLNTRDPSQWTEANDLPEDYLRLLSYASAPSEASRMLLQDLSGDRAQQILSKLGKFEAAPKELFFDMSVFDLRGRLAALATRLAWLETLQVPHLDRYLQLIENPLAEAGDARELHSGVMIQYRMLCAPATTCYGGTFIFLGWMWGVLTDLTSMLEEQVDPDQRAKVRDVRLAFEQMLSPAAPARFDRVNWGAAQDLQCAREIVRMLQRLLRDGYWTQLAAMREKQIGFEASLNDPGGSFDSILFGDFAWEFSVLRELRETSIDTLPEQDRACLSQATASPAEGTSIGISESGVVTTIASSRLTSIDGSLVADFRHLFRDCKRLVRCLSQRPRRSA
jgi:hypothetical protein